MDTPTITQLRELRDSISKARKTIKPKEHSDQKYGNENEFTAKGVLAGLDALTTDLSALLRAPNRFLQVSTYHERTNLVQHFKNIKTHITNKDINNLAVTLDQTKSLIRPYGVRESSERKEEFLNHIDEIQRKCESLGDYIDKLEDIKQQGEKSQEEINAAYESLSSKVSELSKRSSELDELLAKTDNVRKESELYLQNDKKNTQEINSLLNDAKSHKEIIESFSKRVEKREAQLESQEEKTEKFNETLDEYGVTQKNYLNEAEALIDNAKTALQYKTAEGLSAAFSEKYQETKSDRSTKAWVISAGMFVFLAIGVGIWIVWEKDLNLDAIVGRLSLLPILLGAAWFCASQYVKQKNIAEDYAYKSVLAKSIVGFSDQLASETNKGQEYTHYIKSVLEEMHNDPLRRQPAKLSNESTNEIRIERVSDELKELKDLIKRQNDSKNSGAKNVTDDIT